MELKDFISETLSQLVEGVIDAQSKLKDTAGLFALGSQGQSNKNNQSFNKIQFSIPVAFPLQRTEKNN